MAYGVKHILETFTYHKVKNDDAFDVNFKHLARLVYFNGG